MKAYINMKRFLMLLSLIYVNIVAKSTKEVQMELRSRVFESQTVEKLDVLILLDDSNSIVDADFDKARSTSANIIESYCRASDVRIGLIKFATQVNVLVAPTSKCQDLKNAVQGIERERGWTNTREALEQAQLLFRLHARENSKRVLFLITDGRSTSGDPITIANQIKFAQNAIIFGIGIGEVNQDEINRIASPSHFFYLNNYEELNQVTRSLVEDATSNKREVVFQPFLQSTPLSIKQDIPLRVRISNVGSEMIPANSVLYFTSPTNFLVKHSVLVKESIQPHSSVIVNVILPISGSASFKTLPEHIDIEMIDSYGRRVFAEQSRVMMSSDYFIKSFEEQHEDLNVLVFGCIGSGKTSWVNAILSALSSQVQNKGIVGDAGGHGTECLVKFSLWEGMEGIPKIKINFWDTWGVTPDNYEDPRIFPSLLDGQLPEGYHMLQRTALNEFNNISRKPQAFDGVLLFLPWDVMQQKQLMTKMHEVFKVANRKGYNPLIIVTHIDRVDDDALRQKIRKDLAELFRISENRIYLVQNYVKEDTKSFQIDKKNLIILDEIMRIANGKAASRPRSTSHLVPYIATAASLLIGFVVLTVLIGRNKTLAPQIKEQAPVVQQRQEDIKEDEEDEDYRLQGSDSEEGEEATEVETKENNDQEQKEDEEKKEDQEERGNDDTVEEKNEEKDEGVKKVKENATHKIVVVKIVSGASRQFRIGRTTTVRQLLQQAKKVFARNDENADDYYLADQKGATYVESEKAWNGSMFYMNKHTSA